MVSKQVRRFILWQGKPKVRIAAAAVVGTALLKGGLEAIAEELEDLRMRHALASSRACYDAGLIFRLAELTGHTADLYPGLVDEGPELVDVDEREVAHHQEESGA